MSAGRRDNALDCESVLVHSSGMRKSAKVFKSFETKVQSLRIESSKPKGAHS